MNESSPPTIDTHLLSAAPDLLRVVQFLMSIEADVPQRLCQCDEAYCAYCSWLNAAHYAANKALGLPCPACDDVGSVSTMRIDDVGEHVEIACPLCQE